VITKYELWRLCTTFYLYFLPFFNSANGLETVFSQLDGQFLLLHNYAKDVKGIFTRVLANIASIAALQYLNKINNDPLTELNMCYVNSANGCYYIFEFENEIE
jgi:hypothetical protein